MTTEDDLRDLHERTVESGVDRIVEMVEQDGDYLPIIQHLAECSDAIQATQTALIALCVENGLFTMEEFAQQRARATALLDQFSAKARDDIEKAATKRLEKYDA